MTPPMPHRPVGGPSAWLGGDLARRESAWLHRLDEAGIEELVAAARHRLARAGADDVVRAADFPLPRFGAHLARLRDELLHGIGLEVLRGFPIDAHEPGLVETVFRGIGAHLGNARPQNAAGDLLGHVRDVGATSADPNVRIYQTAERQGFHTDSSDVVGLLCLRAAREGGRSLLASAATLHDRLLAERPELLPPLFAPIATDRRGEVPAGARPWLEIPVLSWHAGELSAFYQRRYIDSAQRFDAAPRLTPLHVEALDAFDALADDPGLHLAMDLEPGDMQFIHNHSQLHDRTAFLDWPEPGRRRHLLRLWLSVPGDRALPPAFAERYGSLEPGARGGVTVS